jgi:hypothetical protein
MQCSCPQCFSPLLAQSLEGGQNFYNFYNDYIDDLDDFVDNDSSVITNHLNYSNLKVNVNQSNDFKRENNTISNYIGNFHSSQSSQSSFQPIQSKPIIKESQLLRYRPIKFNDKSLSLFQPR